MNKNIFVYLYGVIVILAGVFLLFSKHFDFNTNKYTLGIALVFGAIIALFTAFSRQRKQVQFAYHEMHALAMFVYGMLVLFFAKTLEELIYLTTFLLMFYSFSEIILSYWLFNLRDTVKLKVLVIRVLLGLVVGIATVVLMNFQAENKIIVMQGYGILFGIIGFNILFYEPIMKKKALTES